MAIRIDNPEMFKEVLQTGVNLFTGAGFSKLPNSKGECLPDAQELCKEICQNFSVPDKYANDLERLSTIVNSKYKQQFQEYLRERFTISDYNDLYDQLNRIKINSFITTNIDNTIHCIIDKGNRYFLSSITYYGATKRDPNAIEFLPLHGDVKNNESYLYFGKFDLATVDAKNKDLFELMFSKLVEAPTLFWGYGFHDIGVERCVGRILEQKRQNIWIQCLPNNDDIDLYRSLDCFIIEGTTEELLYWIKDNIVSEYDLSQDNKGKILKHLKKYNIPTINQIEAVPAKEYYVSMRTQWYNILANIAYERKNVNKIYEAFLQNKNIIVVGIPFSGKTTNLMQLSTKFKPRLTLWCDDITQEEAKFIKSNLNGNDTIILIDNCSEDMIAYKILAECPNIKIIGFTDCKVQLKSTHPIRLKMPHL
jgi:hypothetical protein